MSYDKRNWKSGTTPLSADNLDAMDQAIYQNSQDVAELKEATTSEALRKATGVYPMFEYQGTPTDSTAGKFGQMYWDSTKLRAFLCTKVLHNVHSWHELVLATLKIAGFDLSADITVEQLQTALKVYPVKVFSAAPTASDVGSVGQLGGLVHFSNASPQKVDLYLCVGSDTANNKYTWVLINGNINLDELDAYIDEKLAEKDQPQEIFTDVLAEVGYTENSRVNSSGNVVSWDNSDVTGYIPVKAGDVIRLKDMYVPDTYNETGNSYGQTAYAYTSDKTYLKSVFLCTVNDASLEALDRVVENGSVVQFTVAPDIFGEDVAFIIIGSTDITAASEVYVNSTFVNTNDSGLPTYWLDELSTKADTITKAMETAGRNKSAFLWYTDAHWLNNSQMSPELLKYLTDNTPMNKVNFGGDIICDPAEFTHDNIKYAYEWRKLVAGLPNHHSVIGNHDANHNTTDVSKIAYSFLNAPEETADMIVGGDFYYYIDNPSEKTRYLYLSYLTNDHAEMMAQGQFIVDAIKSAPDNWHIVAIAHRWFQYTSSSNPTVGSTPAYESEILKIFDEYNARAKHTASNYFTAQDFADGKAKVEFCIGGHIHVDYDFETDGGIPVIITTSDTNQDRVPDSEVDSGTLSTITESAVYGIIADYSDSSNTKITVVGIGRGTSRVITKG